MGRIKIVCTIISMVICTAVLCQSVKYNWKRPALSGGAAFVAGGAWGIHEKTMHHWYQFHQRFPRADPKFWNPAISWTNKYRDWPEDQRLRKVPVQFTDAKHLLASTNQAAIFSSGAVIVFGQRRPWWHYGLDFVITSACYSFGNRLAFDWIY